VTRGGRADYHAGSLHFESSSPMKTLVFLSLAAIAASGCTISTQLDPEGSPKYRQAERGTGTNIARHPQDVLGSGSRTLDQDEVDRMMRNNANGHAKGQGT
jgi:hypothetical protein